MNLYLINDENILIASLHFFQLYNTILFVNYYTTNNKKFKEEKKMVFEGTKIIQHQNVIFIC